RRRKTAARHARHCSEQGKAGGPQAFGVTLELHAHFDRSIFGVYRADVVSRSRRPIALALLEQIQKLSVYLFHSCPPRTARSFHYGKESQVKLYATFLTPRARFDRRSSF